VAVDEPDQHAVTERIAATLAGGIDQTVRLIRSQIPAIFYFRLFALAGIG